MNLGSKHSLSIKEFGEAPIYICTTGISKSEISLLSLPENVIIQDRLTPTTNFLATYKFRGSEKYARAVDWGIPIVRMEYLYNFSPYYKQYLMKQFEGALFATSAITSCVYSNFYSLLKAKQQANVSAFIDFLVADDSTTEKYKFCERYSIPIISPEGVFKDNNDFYIRRVWADAKELEPQGMFFGKVFYLDKRLPKVLFNKLRRLIIENDGIRVSILADNVDYIFTFFYDDYSEYSDKLCHYQYVFDCAESKALLYSEFYRVHSVGTIPPMDNAVCVVDSSLGTEYSVYINKLRALGAIVRPTIDMRTTHFISRKVPDKDNSAESHYIVVKPEWVDRCLYMLQHVKETKYLIGKPYLDLVKRKYVLMPMEQVKFQFTGLPNALRDRAIRLLEGFGIECSTAANYDGCTHLIMGAANCSEKFFAAVANGRWILTPEFIDHFRNQPNFNFAKYEWASKSGLTEAEKRYALGAKYWREHIQSGGKPAFYKWAVKLYSPDDKAESYRRLLENGGGRITDADDYTHVFADKRCSEALSEPGVRPADTIFSYLLNKAKKIDEK